MFIIAHGSIANGYIFIGPFQTFDLADEYDSKNLAGNSWILELQNPLVEE